MALWAAMKKRLIIGYGNTLRCDDGLGPYIVKSLRDKVGNLGKNVEIISLPQLDVALTSLISQSDIVLFVDAKTDMTDELVSIKRIKSNASPVRLSYISHKINIPTLLRASLDWFGVEPLCYIVMPKGFNFSVGDTISEKALESANLAQDKIIEILKSFN